MNDHRVYTDRDIHLALDGELLEDERAAFARWLEDNPPMKAVSERYAADRELLRDALAPVADEPLPARFAGFSEAGADMRKVPRRAPWWRAAAAAAIFVAGGAAGYFYGMLRAEQSVSSVLRIADDAVAAHVIFAAEKLHVVEVAADQKDHLVGWLSKRLGTRLQAPDLEREGFRLIGGRLLASGDAPAAQFMYENPEGARISLYVTHCAPAAETGFRLYEHEGARTFYWLDEGFGYAVAGSMPEDMLLRIANASYRQLLSGQDPSG
ncbi:anti-sigma factor RsiW [Mesorhizobium sp. J18]|uniref:anti-sigma factor family protein n=1 Tax=Mesorhizobium sp. J18 TaxID=935263 RepID=UPI00119C76AC|nr:anti-sigma factor [Mesorhizobium sp. J18]TWG94680.1 anti-sigma factor RsiW [Mesorhizobium sp. J18]